MTFEATPLPGSYLVTLTPFSDERGWFARSYCQDEFRQIGHSQPWVQMNHSMTFTRGSLRGMHYQVPPFQEIKMVRCIAGAVFDVIVDLRADSPTLWKWYGAELSAANKQMMYIPQGFAHGFQALTDNCELVYHHSEMYTPNAEAGIRYNDPRISIEWPLPVTVISSRDADHPLIDNNFKGV
jgi:dTDP-4-dehydrorhamnose 3,5-epimerase